MTRANRTGKAVQVYLPPELHARLQALVDANRRSITDEVVHALERHLAAPPVLRMDVPPLADAEVAESVPEVKPVPQKKPRARKKVAE